MTSTPSTLPDLERLDAAAATLTAGHGADVPRHGHPLRGRFNSWFFAVANWYLERRFGALRDGLVAHVRPGDVVVEIGPGNGPLFERLPAGVRVHAIEPSPHFHERLRASARAAGVDLVLHATGAESIPLPDDSVDVVLSAWVLCTVENPDRAVRELRRVLRPGGRFAFYEHVAAPDGSVVRRVQRFVRRPWAWLWEGCRTERDTAALVRRAGFDGVEIDDVRVRTSFVPLRTQVAGVAVR